MLNLKFQNLLQRYSFEIKTLVLVNRLELVIKHLCHNDSVGLSLKPASHRHITRKTLPYVFIAFHLQRVLSL